MQSLYFTTQFLCWEPNKFRRWTGSNFPLLFSTLNMWHFFLYARQSSVSVPAPIRSEIKFIHPTNSLVFRFLVRFLESRVTTSFPWLSFFFIVIEIWGSLTFHWDRVGPGSCWPPWAWWPLLCPQGRPGISSMRGPWSLPMSQYQFSSRFCNQERRRHFIQERALCTKSRILSPFW